MKVSIVIPNYNGEKLLEKNIPSVVEAALFYNQQSKNEVEVIIVDDASQDASKNILEKLHNEYKNKLPFLYTLKDKNEGFAPTVNQGVKKANGEIVILLNSDVSPQKDFLLPLLSHFSEKSIFAVGAMDKSIEKGKEVLRGRGVGKWERGFLIHQAGKLDKNTTLWVGGGSGAFRKNMWEELEGMDELFAPFYWEDIDISYRALKTGLKIYFEKESIVTHMHEEGAIKSKFSQEVVKKIAYRNQFIFVWKNADDTMLWFHLAWLPYHLIKATLRFDKSFFSGFFAACKLLPKILQKRNNVQKKYIFSDYAIIAGYQQ